MDYEYLVICRCELVSSSNDFIDLNCSKFFNDYNDAVNYGICYVDGLANYPACASYSIYKLISD